MPVLTQPLATIQLTPKADSEVVGYIKDGESFSITFAPSHQRYIEVVNIQNIRGFVLGDLSYRLEDVHAIATPSPGVAVSPMDSGDDTNKSNSTTEPAKSADVWKTVVKEFLICAGVSLAVGNTILARYPQDPRGPQPFLIFFGVGWLMTIWREQTVWKSLQLPWYAFTILLLAGALSGVPALLLAELFR